MSENLNSALDTAGPQAGRIEDLWWLLFGFCAVVFVAVMAVLVAALVRRRTPDESMEPTYAGQRTALRYVGAGLLATGAILFGFLIASVTTDRGLDEIETGGARVLTITGRQWWWEIRYEDARPDRVVVTANEIHVPVGQPVLLRLRGSDVIHSFWVPSLAGKRDLIPGRDTGLWIQADRPGTFQGQCAEFCGHQHAHMRFLVIAQPPAEFEAWLEGQRASAPEPATDEERRGREVFLAGSCVMCHTIRGTAAGSIVGPDLTHLASRQTIAAGARPNTRDHLAAWVADPQRTKPGARMPVPELPPADLQALVTYLRSLR